jgi:hypothetical protein
VESAIFTGLGLAPSAGLNAYIPLLTLALADRFTDRITLDRPYDFISSAAGIIILLLLLTIELIADKVPGIDHANDLLQSAVRPASGAILMMASTHHSDAMNPVVAMFIGLLLAGVVHGVKATARPAITVATGGLGNPIVSMVEDGVSGLTSILAVLVPIASFAILIPGAVFTWWLYKKIGTVTGVFTRRSRPVPPTTLR